MSLLRRLVVSGVRALVQNPEAQAKAREVIDKEVKPRARQAWKQAQPEIGRVRRDLGRLARRVREQYREGRDRGTD